MEEDPILVCGPISYFPDDLRGQCVCGRLIIYRPHTAHIKKKLCTGCARRIIAEHKEDRTIVITDKVWQEVQEFRKSRSN